MKNLSEYTENTSEYELFSFLSDKIISGEIIKFSQLTRMAAPILKYQRIHPVLISLFDLIKKLYWGFFATMTRETHQRLWKELIIQDSRFPSAGDLRETLEIPDLYVSILYIHGYTQFCMESRKKSSVMHTIDHAIDDQISRIADACQAIGHRERGDEIVVVAATASDALTVTLAIMDYFGKTNVVDDSEIPTRRGEKADAMPIFQISAGIACGGAHSPLVISQKGGLSGFLLNSGGRLQTRANELSGSGSQLMISKQVHVNYISENEVVNESAKENESAVDSEKVRCAISQNNAVSFLDTGQIDFHGVHIPSCEVLFREEDKYKEELSKELEQLFSSIKEKLWEQKIFHDMISLISKAAQAMPKFEIVPPSPIYDMEAITNGSFVKLCNNALRAYVQDEDYAVAVNMLKTFIYLGEQIPGFDRLILDYLRCITDKYDILLGAYEETIEKEIEDRAANIFKGDLLKAWQAAKNAVGVFEKLKAAGRKSNEVPLKKTLWYNLIHQNADQMELALHSGI